MLEKFGRAAEQVATGLSRRQFLGRLGQAAIGVAGVLAASSLFGAHAHGGAGNLCGPSSPNGCANRPVGSPCVGSPGKCWSNPKQYDSLGLLICNVCRLPNKNKD